MKKNKKKSKKRKIKKRWGLEKLTLPKAVQQFFDYDYLNQLTEEEKNWLSQFTDEYYNNTLNHDWRKNFHYKEQKKSIYDATNARNRDMYNKRYKYNETLIGVAIPDDYHTFTSPEDAILDAIDLEEKIKKFREAAEKAQTAREFTNKLVGVVFEVDD
jgi:hypothetical protein